MDRSRVTYCQFAEGVTAVGMSWGGGGQHAWPWRGSRSTFPRIVYFSAGIVSPLAGVPRNDLGLENERPPRWEGAGRWSPGRGGGVSAGSQ